jgi:hypothetical protein
MTKHIVALAAVLSLTLLPGRALADVFVTVNATALRLQNYEPDTVVIWFSGSTCGSGQLVLPASTITAEKSRLWATVMGAKLGNRQVFFYYDNSSGNCVITSFGLDN